ncbi:MAG: hypothetical protein AB9917_02010 [Negativicutes bacterium]
MKTSGIAGAAVVMTVLAAIGTVIVIRELVRLTMPVWIWIDTVNK